MTEKLKAAAYVRVSMETMQMQHSRTAQEAHFCQRIKENREWEFAGVYVDDGISGTGMEQREAFLRMLKDCEDGKIDVILVKSVSRFARNTVDLLKIVRHLKKMGISVQFEEQKIDSMTEEGELLLTLMASVAQAESESISENAKWAIRKAFQKGIGNTKRRTFGYQWVNGDMVIIAEEAEAVRRIFNDFLAGCSQMKIAEKLTEEGVRSVNGNPMSVSAVGNILKNITYTGNTLLQKTFIQDPISKKKRMNRGELPQYFVQDTHEAIIDMDTFRRVQEKLLHNKEKGCFPYNRTGKQYPFTGKVLCASCGRHYTRQLWNTSKAGPKRPTWICSGKKVEKYRRCSAKNLSEEKLMKVSAQVLGIEEFEEAVFEEKVEKITVITAQGERTLRFHMRDGTQVDIM